MTSFKICLATKEHIPALLELENLCFDYEKLNKHRFLYMLDKAHASLWIALEHHILVGYILLLFNRSSQLARIYSLAVHPSYRGQGIAKLLLAKAEKETREKHYKAIRLEVREDNLASIALYEKQGFSIIKKLPDYYSNHIDGLRLEKKLLSISFTESINV